MYIKERSMDMFKSIIMKVFTILVVLIGASLVSVSIALAMSLDERIDLAMNAIEGPVFHKTLVPYGTQEGAPLFPIYKQQPPAAQQDFRPPPPPPAPIVVTPAPEPEPEPEPATPVTPGKPCIPKPPLTCP
jgi:hypothetical protein